MSGAVELRALAGVATTLYRSGIELTRLRATIRSGRRRDSTAKRMRKFFLDSSMNSVSAPAEVRRR